MANEWQIESVYAEALTRATAVPAQVEAVYAEVLSRATAVPAQVESVYAEVLTSGKPTDAYSSAVLADSPLAYWKANDTAGSTLTLDTGGQGRHGTNVGSFGSTASAITSSGTALTDAANAFSYVSNPSWATGLGDFTVEGWFKTSDTSQMGILTMDDINQAPGAVGRKFAVYIVGGQLTFMCFTNAGGYPYIQSPLTYIDGNWHHVMATRSGVAMTLYADGAQVATTTQTGVTWTGSSVDLMLAGFRWSASGQANSAGKFFNGTLDELSIYGTALSSARVNAHYTAGAPAAAPATPAFTGWGRPL